MSMEIHSFIRNTNHLQMTMNPDEDPYLLQRFLNAQATVYKTALSEIQNGRKRSHWMWYIFPQFDGLGRSATAMHYAIKSKDEAIAYFNHPMLGNRLKEITTAFLGLEGMSAYDILGGPDDLKMRSSMTLFSRIQSETDLFEEVLDKYFNGKPCGRTLSALKMS